MRDVRRRSLPSHFSRLLALLLKKDNIIGAHGTVWDSTENSSTQSPFCSAVLGRFAYGRPDEDFCLDGGSIINSGRWPGIMNFLHI